MTWFGSDIPKTQALDIPKYEYIRTIPKVPKWLWTTLEPSLSESLHVCNKSSTAAEHGEDAHREKRYFELMHLPTLFPLSSLQGGQENPRNALLWPSIFHPKCARAVAIAWVVTTQLHESCGCVVSRMFHDTGQALHDNKTPTLANTHSCDPSLLVPWHLAVGIMEEIVHHLAFNGFNTISSNANCSNFINILKAPKSLHSLQSLLLWTNMWGKQKKIMSGHKLQEKKCNLWCTVWRQIEMLST